MLSRKELLEKYDKLYWGKPNPNAIPPEEILKDIEKALYDPSLRNGLSEEQVRQAYEFAKQVVEKNKAKAPV